jgi:phosphohistidine phosphatase
LNLLVVRHTIAEPRKTFAETGQDDSLRPLTVTGRERFERGAFGIKALVPELDAIVSSPLTRSFQTAEILASAYQDITPARLEALAPGGERRAVLSWIQMQRDEATVAVVGHEPDLAALASWLLSSSGAPFLSFKKGGACLLTWSKHVTAGDAQLAWLLTARQLRRIGKAGYKKARGSSP